MLASRAMTGMFDVFAMIAVRSDNAAARTRVFERAQLVQRVGQLVAPLAAAHVDDHVRVTPFRDLLEEHGLAGAEATEHRGRRTFRDRLEEVEDPLTGDERDRGFEAIAVRAWLADRPPLGDGDRDAVDGGDRILRPIRAWRREPADRAGEPGRYGYVLWRAAGVGCDCEHRAGRDGFADGRLRLDHPLPSDRPERTGCQPLGPVEQRAQQAVEHSAEQPRSERRRERPAMADDRGARTHSARVLVDLHDHSVPGERDHLTRQAAFSDLHEVEPTHRAGQALDVEQRAVDPHDATSRCRLGSRLHIHNVAMSAPNASRARSASVTSR